MKKIFAIVFSLIILFSSSGVYTVFAEAPPYQSFQFNDASEWIQWIINADYDEIKTGNQPNYSNRILVEVPRTAGYILVPKWNGMKLPDIHNDDIFPISTYPATYDKNNKLMYLGYFLFDVQVDDMNFCLNIYPITPDIDSLEDYIWAPKHKGYEYKLMLIEDYAVVILAEESMTDEFYSKFSFDKVMLSNPDEVAESIELDINKLKPIKRKANYSILIFYIGVVLVAIGAAYLVTRKKLI